MQRWSNADRLAPRAASPQGGRPALFDGIDHTKDQPAGGFAGKRGVGLTAQEAEQRGDPGGARAERLAKVLFLTEPSWRKDSRRMMAGGRSV